MTVPLPEWLIPTAKDWVFDVDVDKAYPYMLDLLAKHNEFDRANPDQYWLEVAYQCIKLDTQMWLNLAGLDPRPNKTLSLLMGGAEGFKDRWGQAGKPEGRYSEIRKECGLKRANTAEELMQAMKSADRKVGLEARGQYKKIRGFLPQ